MAVEHKRLKGLLLDRILLTSFSLKCKMHCSISGALDPFATQAQGSVGESEGSILSAVSVAYNPTRKATRTAYTATGRSSERLWQQLTAAAASAPVHRPTAKVFDAHGYDPLTKLQ